MRIKYRDIRFWLTLGVTLALVVFRLSNLGRFPPGLSNDETEYAISAKSYILNGKDISGYGLPLTLVKSATDGVISPIPAVMSSVFLVGLNLNLFTIRLPYVIVNLLTGLGVFFAVYSLTKKPLLGWICGIWFLANPWSVYFAHNTADAPFALMFYLWGVVAYLNRNKLSLLVPITLFTAGFFSYHGAKPLLIPIVSSLALLTWYWQKNFRSFILSALMIIYSIIITMGFLYFAKTIPGAIALGQNNTNPFSQTDIGFLVNETRRKSVESPFSPILVNKYSQTFKFLAQKYLGALSPITLFVSGDEMATYHFGDHGLFYYADIILIGVGLFSLFKNFNKLFILDMALIIISPISTLLSSVNLSVINRSFLLLPALIIAAGAGIYSIFNHSKLRILLVMVLALSVVNFWYWWSYEFPVQGGHNYWLAERVAANYMKLENPNTQIVYITNETWNELLRQVFYDNPQNQSDFLKSSYEYSGKGIFKYHNISFTSSCPSSFDDNTIYLVKRGAGDCFYRGGYSNTIVDMRDSGDVFRIYNGTECQNFSTDIWRRYNYAEDFDIETMDVSKFCNRWINLPK